MSGYGFFAAWMIFCCGVVAGMWLFGVLHHCDRGRDG
jgi:hypothetical protein